ncbi:phosphohydrolase [Acinetobacter sp. ANC 4558]|uniref:HD domain-containing protein n=1 Tax=Acinetobacter sp. ANC 4558 TaxID=1977876 RepID=UPI000A354D45|nr:HD domain-containing protein [Acinetobacter sp. ANC 4558]OTG88041.1 phosphohydrolase [Acinetobacter sp. ANC 4558]
MNHSIALYLPNTALIKEVTELVRDTETELLFNHSSRVYYWGALAASRKNIQVDHELLYISCMFHDMGLTQQYCSCDKRFEVDGANAAADFMRSHHFEQTDIDKVWTAIALHTTPGIPEFMAAEIAMVTAGVEMDVLGMKYDEYSDQERESVLTQYPREKNFKEAIIQSFYDGIKFKPETTFGNVKANVIQDKENHFQAMNFCSIIRNSKWNS